MLRGQISNQAAKRVSVDCLALTMFRPVGLVGRIDRWFRPLNHLIANQTRLRMLWRAKYVAVEIAVIGDEVFEKKIVSLFPQQHGLLYRYATRREWELACKEDPMIMRAYTDVPSSWIDVIRPFDEFATQFPWRE